MNEENEKAHFIKDDPSVNAWHPFLYRWNELPRKLPYIEPHFHSEFEIDHVEDGDLRFNIGNQECVGKKGDIFIINPKEIHSIFPLNQQSVSGAFHTFIFTPSLLVGSISERCYTSLFPILHGKKKIASPITKEHPYYCEIQTSMENIIVALQEDTPMHDLMLKSELLRLFYFLLQYENEEQPTREKVIPVEIYTVLKYIAEHYTEKIHIQELSKMTFLSHSRFLALFKQATGISPIHYLNFLRIKKACRMLVENPNETVIRIANACGFNNISNFNTQFKEVVTNTPSGYRCRFKALKKAELQ